MRKLASVPKMIMAPCQNKAFLTKTFFLKLFSSKHFFSKKIKSSLPNRPLSSKWAIRNLAAALVISLMSALFLSTTAYASISNQDGNNDHSPIAINVVVPARKIMWLHQRRPRSQP